MSDLRIYIPKALAFQRVAKTAVAAASQVDHGTEINEAHAFALLEFFEFLAPEQITPLMGPGLGAELSAIIESEFDWDSLGDRTPLQNLLCTHASLFAALFCCDGTEKPRCYRRWLRSQKRNAAGSSCDRHAYLMANFEMAMGLGRGPEASNQKLRLLKYRIATRTAELLLAAGFQPETTLCHLRKDDVPKPAEILAMQMMVLLKKSPDDLARICGWGDQSCEAAFLCWASRDSFVEDALVAWRWLNPVAYDQVPDTQSECLGDHLSPLYTAWRAGKAVPAKLALREEPWTETDAEQPFPRLLAKDVKPRFSPVPLMLIGSPGVGKTAFLCALANHLNCARGQVREGVCVESSDLQELCYPKPESALGTNSSACGMASYKVLVRDAQDPEVARWMRLRFDDYSGSDISRGTFSPEFLTNLRAARGLLFFLDDRSFPDLLPNSGDSGVTADHHKEALELAALYTRILQCYFDVNKDALHLPVGLVVNKVDLLLGLENLLSLNPPFLIPERTKVELVHTGRGVQGEATEPFARLRSCIRYNLAISRNSQNQHFVFELIERFRGFIAAAMCHTYRFQIFLTSSLVPTNENCQSLPHGVWEVIKWIFNQLDPGYRLQANESVERAYTELEELRKPLSAAIFRDHEAHLDFRKAVEERNHIVAKVPVNILDHLLQKRVEYASDRMRAALGDALALAELPAVADATDPVPFALRRRQVKDALERLEYQIAYLKEWHDRLSGVQESVLMRPKTPKNEGTALRNHLANERRAS